MANILRTSLNSFPCGLKGMNGILGTQSSRKSSKKQQRRPTLVEKVSFSTEGVGYWKDQQSSTAIKMPHKASHQEILIVEQYRKCINRYSLKYLRERLYRESVCLCIFYKLEKHKQQVMRRTIFGVRKFESEFFHYLSCDCTLKL